MNDFVQTQLGNAGDVVTNDINTALVVFIFALVLIFLFFAIKLLIDNKKQGNGSQYNKLNNNTVEIRGLRDTCDDIVELCRVTKDTAEWLKEVHNVKDNTTGRYLWWGDPELKKAITDLTADLVASHQDQVRSIERFTGTLDHCIQTIERSVDKLEEKIDKVYLQS